MSKRRKEKGGMAAAFDGYIDCRLDDAQIERIFMNPTTSEQVMSMIYAALVDGCKFSIQFTDSEGWCKVALFMLDENNPYAGKMLTSEAESILEALTLMYEKYMVMGREKLTNLKAAEAFTGRKPR